MELDSFMEDQALWEPFVNSVCQTLWVYSEDIFINITEIRILKQIKGNKILR